MKAYGRIDELIGNTPLVRLSRIEEKFGLSAKIFAKLEGQNPTGSAKARVALAIIDDAEEKGLLKPGSVIIEPTSGNTGIGIAAIASVRGYRAVIVMPDTMSKERRTLMTAYGAELVLTDGALGMAGAIAEAERIKEKTPGAIIAGQFTNPENPLAHKRTTGPEIYRDTEGEVDVFVAGIGTGGTLSGVGEYLKEMKPNVRIVGVEPASSAVISGEKPGAHKIQGIGAGFIPQTLNLKVIDRVHKIEDSEAMEAARQLAHSEAVLAGISSGAALAGAIKEAKLPENEGKNIVVLLPDTGERYLSSGLFD